MSTDTRTVPEDDCVRPIQEKDEKMVKMLIGQGVMEGLAKANNKFITNPVVITLILFLGLGLNRLMSFNQSTNYLSYFTPIIGPCLVLLPVLGSAEYIHRPVFSAALRKIIGSEDLIRLNEYYSNRSSSSSKGEGNDGWVFVHKHEIVGVILVDTGRAGESLDSVLGEEEGQISENRKIKDAKRLSSSSSNETQVKSQNKIRQTSNDLRKRNTTSVPVSTDQSPSANKKSNLIQIRHFDIDVPYRQAKTGVSKDLLSTALNHYFSNPPSNPSSKSDAILGSDHDGDTILIELKPFSKWTEEILTQFGFKRITPQRVNALDLVQPNSTGLLGWKGCWMELRQEDWIKRKDQIISD
ncbi:uncharacterized protein I303_108381 [Kwoniella dejecticola CBS 10117]|uniref:Uncharacterized protein n=1 Tax=Kwoniella dejecticola CBS 10117 TaxID=1296121 RepID=A0A1A5ZXJ6_9TREE|nr:uncharacterized protein I303_07292 [Kwoniella dejecticola CBS 10117]OBR82532.1 hypothetical protein I303_07292 [Kwoniella dejecticola CBS 10117]